MSLLASRAPRASNVLPHPYALACHAALADILALALSRAVASGMVSEQDSQELFALAVSSHSGRLRFAIEATLARCGVENST